MTRALIDPFSSLKTAARSHMAGHFVQAAASPTNAVNSVCFSSMPFTHKTFDLFFRLN
jgi:hypothetical protein